VQIVQIPKPALLVIQDMSLIQPLTNVNPVTMELIMMMTRDLVLVNFHKYFELIFLSECQVENCAVCSDLGTTCLYCNKGLTLTDNNQCLAISARSGSCIFF